MSFDCSRFTFNAWHDFLGVVMQQGRVQLDADWNEFASQLLRRLQAGSLDTFGPAVVPRVTPNGFRIEAAGGALTIGVGRLYLDGLLAENHGAAPKQWDSKLAELTGSVALNYTTQPYYPNPPSLPTGGPHLVYLDVWQRELTHLQYPDLVEKAVGVDTTARLQTAWQVKVLPRVGTITCGTPDADIPGWVAATALSGGRLTSSTGAVAETPNPCLIPPSGGYRGLENQLYRVEIHSGGAVGTATFKWSRDNATVASRVTHINTARDRLVVESLGRDAILRFVDGDWVEITDDVRELHGLPGIMARILQGGGVDEATRTLVLETPLSAGIFPTTSEQTDPLRNTRMRRWDQSGRVLRADGTLFHDLDASTTGLIPVPPVGTAIFLEHGILVNFNLDPAGSHFHVSDYWVFAARTADANIERLNQAPPRGIHHHYARLAIVNFPDTETDCRVLWPPEATTTESCACDRCVTPEGHNAGTATIQQAIDALTPTGGVICLDVGLYRLREPLRITNASSLRIRGKGFLTRVVSESPGPLLLISDSAGVVIENFAAAGAATDQTTSSLIDAQNTLGLELDHLFLLALPTDGGFSTAITFGGYALGLRVRECALIANTGIVGGDSKGGLLLTSALQISNNLFLCDQLGIHLARLSLHHGQTHIAHNLILNARIAGMVALGASFPSATFAIESNVLHLQGKAIVAGVDGLRILNNEIAGLTQKATSGGVVLETGLNRSGIGHCWITGNRISNMPGAGIAVRTALGSALIKQNIIERTRQGLVFEAAGSAVHLSIENNQFLHIAADFNPQGESVVAIQILRARHVDLVGNVVSDFAANAVQAADRVAIRIVGGGAMRISSNHLSDLGPIQEHLGYVAGIELVTPFTLANIADNCITRTPEGDVIASAWIAIRMVQPTAAAAARVRSVYAGAALLLAGKEGFLLTGTRLVAFALTLADSASVRGNQIMARACLVPLVQLQGALSTLFTDNHCEAEPAATQFAPAIVDLRGGAIIASNNRVRWTSNDHDAIHISGSKAFTVVGNITMGNIRVDGAPLPAPWAPLNVLAS